MKRIAFVLYQGSPLQYARLSALAERVELCLVQVTASSAHYDWGAAQKTPAFKIEVLFPTPPSNREEERSVIAALNRLDPDIVFILGYGRRFSRGAFSYALTRNKRVVMISDTSAQNVRAGLLGRVLKSAIVGSIDSAFVAGTPQARYVESLGVQADRVAKGYDVVDNATLARAVEAARAGVPHSYAPPMCLCVTRLIAEKNLPLLIDAFGDYVRERPISRRALWIAGYGPLQESLQSQIDAAGLADRVRLLGGVPYAEMPALYAATDAVVLPSRSETWGLVINEAMAAGLAVIVSSACGCVEDLVIPGETGLVFDPNDRAGLVAALQRLDEDPGLAERMGARGQEIIADWDLDRFVSGAIAAARIAEMAPPNPLRRLLTRAVLAFLRLRPDRARGFGG